ncbi:hypothetical protein V6N11_030730 [Hibiscus sabdariffa]|uniref:F-box domain-containing protein n=2 Tax=Hibiscus sabdariffa TaxID=183260 RepID=A0ABR2BBA8_9ROSI
MHNYEPVKKSQQRTALPKTETAIVTRLCYLPSLPFPFPFPFAKGSKNKEMSDYMPVEVILKILKRLPVKSLVRCRSVCKTWNSLICDPSFISTHLQASLSNNTPFLLLGCKKLSRHNFSLHYDNDGFEEFKQLQFPPFGYMTDSPLVGSCNGLICVQLVPYDGHRYVLWNPSIQNYISLPRVRVSEIAYINVGFGFDSTTNDYKLLLVGFDMDDKWIQPYLFSLNGNSWKRVTAVYPDYDFGPETSLPFGSGAVHWLGQQERRDGEFGHAVLGFDLSAEKFFEINMPESLIGLGLIDLSIMKYGESSIAVSTDPRDAEHELWIMKKYGVVESWTKVLTLHTVPRYARFPRLKGFRKNGEVLLEVDDGKIISLDLNSQQRGASLYLNCEQMGFHRVKFGADLLSVHSFVESLVLLDKAVDVHSDSDVDHSMDSSDSDESSGGEVDVHKTGP